MTNVLIPVAVLAVMGLLFAIMLGQIATKFEVKIDDTEEAVLNALPGANCGACGYPGCAGCAKAIRNGEAEVSACVIGGPSTTEAVAKAMGVEGVDGMSQAEYRKAAVDAVRQLAEDVGIPTTLKGIVKEEDIPELAKSAYADACRPGNPRETSEEEIAELYRSLM